MTSEAPTSRKDDEVDRTGYVWRASRTSHNANGEPVMLMYSASEDVIWLDLKSLAKAARMPEYFLQRLVIQTARDDKKNMGPVVQERRTHTRLTWMMDATRLNRLWQLKQRAILIAHPAAGARLGLIVDFWETALEEAIREHWPHLQPEVFVERANAATRKSKGRPSSANIETLRQVMRLHNERFTLVQMAKELGVTYMTARRWLENAKRLLG